MALIVNFLKFHILIDYDLLQANEFERLLRQLSLLSEELAAMKEGDLVIIDEIQKLPHLLDEIHS